MDAFFPGAEMGFLFPSHVGGNAAGTDGDAAIRRARELAHDVHDPVEKVIDDVEAQEHGAAHTEGAVERGADAHGALHEIKREAADLAHEFVPHVLPLLFLHVPRKDLYEAVPGPAPSGDGDDVVARNEGEVLRFKRVTAPPCGGMTTASPSRSAPGTWTTSRPSMVNR